VSQEFYISYRLKSGEEVGLGMIKPETVKIGGQAGTMEELAALLSWQAPHDCEECGHGED
jgi:hypothetical protein